MTTWLGATALSGVLRRRVSGAAPEVLTLGLNTWSLRELTQDAAIPAILRVMKQTGMRHCQLLFSHAEPAEFDPGFAKMMRAGATPPTAEQVAEQTRKAQDRTAWRLSVPIAYFEDLRERFLREGVVIQAYASPLGSTSAETDRVLLMAKTLGAVQVSTRVAEDETDKVAAAAARQGIFVGLQGTDTRLIARQIRTSKWLRPDPDLGDLARSGVSSADYVREHLDVIATVDLKDTILHGGSVPFGSGNAPLQQVLKILSGARRGIVAYIDCDYPGTGRSTEEVERCVRYIRGLPGTFNAIS